LELGKAGTSGWDKQTFLRGGEKKGDSGRGYRKKSISEDGVGVAQKTVAVNGVLTQVQGNRWRREAR